MGETVMNDRSDEISFRTMTVDDIGSIPIGCQGDRNEVTERIRDLGSSAILAFDGARHIGQLQFRRYAADTRSPEGIWNPLYWGDFGSHAPELPKQTLAIFCYHVGQLDDTDQRDPAYQGRGIGLRLLDTFLQWAEQAGYEAIVAKATPSVRSVMSFMGGQPVEAYLQRRFQVTAGWVDPQLLEAVRERDLVPAGSDDDNAARVSCCVRRL
jgi:GNAT superfamily N-acetyltransferase